MESGCSGGGGGGAEEGPLPDLWLPFLGGEVLAGGWGVRSVHGINDD